jgi:cell wall assembly regulator SMI1
MLRKDPTQTIPHKGGTSKLGRMGVAESWARVVAWCEEHAPATAEAIRPPAGISALREAEALTGGSWPDDLRTWLHWRTAQNVRRPVMCSRSTVPCRCLR